MNTDWSINRIAALVIGIIFTLVGILGFFATSTMMPGYLFGFGVDLIHNLLHLVIGILGIISAFTGWPRRYNQIFGIIYLVLGILGLFPGLHFGMPGDMRLLGITFVNGADNVLHLVVGIAQIIIGFFVRGTDTGRDTYNPTPTA